MSLPVPAARASKQASSGQRKYLKVTKGKLPRASLAGLVSESSQKKARGKELYDLEPSPQKKRASLPPQIAALEDEEDDIVPETSQVQPDDDVPAEIPESLDVSAPTETYGDDDIVDAPTSPIMPRETLPSSAKKQRGRPRKSGDGVASLVPQENATEKVALLAPFEPEKEAPSAPGKRQGRSSKSGESVTSLTPEEESTMEVNTSTIASAEKNLFEEPKEGRGRSRKSGESLASRAAEASADSVQEEATAVTSAAPKKRLGRPRKSGERTTSRPPAVAFADADENFRDTVLQDMQTQRPAAAMETKRKGRPERDIDTTTNGEATAGPRPAKKVKKLKGPKMISPDEPAFEEDVLPPISTPRQDVPQAARKNSRQESREFRRQDRRQAAQPRGDPQPRVEISTRSTRTLSSRSQGEPANAPEPSSVPGIVRKGAAKQRIAAKTRAAVASSATEPPEPKKTNRQIHISFPEPSPAPQADGEEAVSGSTEATSKGLHEKSQKRANDNAHAIDREESQEDDDEGGDVRNDQAQEGADGDADDAQDDDQANPHRSQLPALDEVLNFTNVEERSGVCTVGLARKIHRACDRVHVTLSKKDCSYDDIAECKDDLVRRLASIGCKIPEDVRFDFKRDAFAYLFHALTSVFEAMYDKFQQEQAEEGEVMESLEALQVLHPFIREMLRFKDTMDSWKVKVTGQGQGDRLIRGVESDLIVPLRKVEKDFKMRLNGLRKAEQDRRTRVEMQRQRERQEQETIKQEEALSSARERRKRWQDLHIARMQCESDPYRRRRLRFLEPPDAMETDANGNEFERVPFFGERNAPPPSSVIASSGKEWTSEQDAALLDALQSFTRKFACQITLLNTRLTTLAALEDIFKEHCRSRGALREFSVSDFAAKLAWVRSSWAQLLHLHPNWELPEWVKKIPVLP
jgi:hypothetical protein